MDPTFLRSPVLGCRLAIRARAVSSIGGAFDRRRLADVRQPRCDATSGGYGRCALKKS